MELCHWGFQSVLVHAELLLRRPWFPGNSDIDQLGKVYQALGTPTPEAWPSVQLLPHYMEFTSTPAVPLRQIFRQVGQANAVYLTLSKPAAHCLQRHSTAI